MRRGQRRRGLPPGCRRGSGAARRGGGSRVLQQRPRSQRCPRKRRCPSRRRPLPARHGASAAASGSTTRQHRAYPARASRPPTLISAWAARVWAAQRGSGLSPRCGGVQPLAAAWGRGRRGRSRLRRRPQGADLGAHREPTLAAAACTEERRSPPLLCRAAARPTRGTGGAAPAPPPPLPPPPRALRPQRPLHPQCPLRLLRPGPSHPPPPHALARLRATQAKCASPSSSKAARLRLNPRAHRRSAAK